MNHKWASEGMIIKHFMILVIGVSLMRKIHGKKPMPDNMP